MDAATGGHGFETVDTTPEAIRQLLLRHASADRGGGGGGVR